MAKKVIFKLPDGFSWPEGSGKEIEVLATISDEGDGKGCLKAIDDYELYSEKDKSYSEAASEAMEK